MRNGNKHVPIIQFWRMFVTLYCFRAMGAQEQMVAMMQKYEHMKSKLDGARTALAETADKRQTAAAPRDSITPYFIISIIFWVTPSRLNSHSDELISPHSWLTFTFVLVLMNIQCSLHG